MKNVKLPPQVYLYSGAFIIIVWILYLSMKRIGLIRSREAIKEEQKETKNIESLLNSDYFNPSLYKKSNYGYAHLASNETVNKWAKKIWNSWGWFNDNEESVYGVFREVGSKIQISQLADAYYQLFGVDLIGDLKHYLDDSEISFLWSIIDKKTKA